MGEVKCGNCGGPVTGEPGAMACPYCGMRVDIPQGPVQRSNANEVVQTAAARRHDSYEEDDESQRNSSPSSSSSSVGAPVVMAIVAVVAVVFIGVIAAATRSKSKKSAKDEGRKTTSTAAAATTTTTSKKPTPPAYVENVAIPSCKCAFGDGQSTPLVTLTLRAAPLTDPARMFDLKIERQSGFVSEMRSSVLLMSSDNALSPNDAGALPAHLGVACDTGVYVLVSDKTASGWSSVNAAWKWTTALPATMTDGADASAPAPPTGAGFAPYCTSLATQNGNATISLANGRKATLSLKDGKLR
jgi:uncharacterized Zn finger protein (UPF0148 family)